MHRTTRSALSLLALVPLTGCASAGLNALDLEDPQTTISGQAVLFVGRDPETLRTDIYVVHAQERLRGDSGTASAPDLDEVADFTVDAVTELQPGAFGSPMTSESDLLFSSDAPFPVPDREGQHVLLTARTPDPAGGIGAGRAALVGLTDRQSEVTPDVPGLRAARFSWGGAWLVLSGIDPTTCADALWLLPRSGPWTDADLRPVDGGGASLALAGLLRDSDELLVTASWDDAGVTELHRLDPDATDALALDADCDGDCTLLFSTAQLGSDPGGNESSQRPVSDPSQSPDGRWLAVTAEGSEESSLRQVLLLDLDGGPDAPPVSASAELGADCSWPAWSPVLSADDGPTLSFVCVQPDSGRPDIWLYRPQSEDRWNTTSGAQPGVPGDSMDGLVLRSRPRWSPSGEVLVFGGSTYGTTTDGGDVTLLALRPTDDPPRAWPMYEGSEGADGWAHFSGTSGSDLLLLWETSETGLEDTLGWPHQPIRAVQADRENPDTTFVELGRDLLVQYPLFLGHNSRFYE